MKLTEFHLKLLAILSVAIIISILIYLGPMQVSVKPYQLHVVPGQVFDKRSKFNAQRNFINYKTKPEQSSLPRPAVESLGKRFGVSVEAIFNANNQRGKQSLDVKDSLSIRIPL
jgi:hypothetical protein